jgi:hypothetical protein
MEAKIEQINITLTKSENLLGLDNDFVIIDMPGVDDNTWFKETRFFIEKKYSSILPLFVVDLTVGGFKLE